MESFLNRLEHKDLYTISNILIELKDDLLKLSYSDLSNKYCTLHGLCSLLNDEFFKNGINACSYTMVENLSLGWEHHSGNVVYPVPYSGSNWTNSGLSYRIMLVEFIESKINKMLYYY